jgi:hypothetical protein
VRRFQQGRRPIGEAILVPMLQAERQPTPTAVRVEQFECIDLSPLCLSLSHVVIFHSGLRFRLALSPSNSAAGRSRASVSASTSSWTLSLLHALLSKRSILLSLPPFAKQSRCPWPGHQPHLPYASFDSCLHGRSRSQVSVMPHSRHWEPRSRIHHTSKLFIFVSVPFAR